MVGAQQSLSCGQGLLEQRDRVGYPVRREIGGGEAVPRVQGVRMVRPQQPLKVGSQRLADRDGLRGTIAQLNEVIKRDEPEPQHNSGQVPVGLPGEPGRVLQQRLYLLGDIPDRRTILRPAKRNGARFQHGCGDPADRRQPLPTSQPVTDHPRHQAMHDNGLAVQAEAQQRPVVQPLQRPVHLDCRYSMTAAGQHARLPGDMQHFAANPGRRQHGHDLQRPGRHARPIGRPDRLQGQQHRPRDTVRVRLLLLLGQVSLDR